LADDLFEHARDAAICEAAVGFERQAFASEGIDNSEHAHSAAGCQHVGSKVQCPFLIRCYRERTLQAGSNQALTFAALHAKPRFAVYAPNAFVIHLLITDN
jgi:hypothetical protein